ncbi:unnamed protein product, partial [marine sediment metagenome]
MADSLKAVLSKGLNNLDGDKPSHPFVSGGHGATVGSVSNTLATGGLEGLSDLEDHNSLTLAKELDADGGGGASLSLLDYGVKTARQSYAKARPKWSRQQRRAFQRIMSGVE